MITNVVDYFFAGEGPHKVTIGLLAYETVTGVHLSNGHMTFWTQSGRKFRVPCRLAEEVTMTREPAPSKSIRIKPSGHEMLPDFRDLIDRLEKRATIRRQIKDRKSVQEGKPDRIADLLDEAAGTLRDIWTYGGRVER